jgi:hypothetical protein
MGWEEEDEITVSCMFRGLRRSVDSAHMLYNKPIYVQIGG